MQNSLTPVSLITEALAAIDPGTQTLRNTQAIAGKWDTGSRRIFVRHQGATSVAFSDYGTVVATQTKDEKDKRDGMSFDRNRLSGITGIRACRSEYSIRITVDPNK